LDIKLGRHSLVTPMMLSHFISATSAASIQVSMSCRLELFAHIALRYRARKGQRLLVQQATLLVSVFMDN